MLFQRFPFFEHIRRIYLTPIVPASLMAVLLIVYAAPSRATASYPDRPVTIVVPFAPGGGTDIIARMVAEKLGNKFNQSFIVQNLPGAGGTIGAASVARAKPDGYTLLVYHIGMISSTYQFKLPYDPVKDFTPITLLTSAANLVAINPNLPVNSLREFIAYAKAHPNELNFGSSGIGGADHLAGELLNTVADIQTTHVPYRGGSPAIVAAVSGEVQFVMGTASQVVGMVKAGRLKALAVMQKKRIASLPDIPTTEEAGLPELDYSTWFALWGPADVPSDIVLKLNKAVAEALEQDEMRVKLAEIGVEPVFTTPQEFQTMFQAESVKWDKILKNVFADKKLQ
ncbi:tripartite tricarboxylate transporter substrate binding protein [Pollutimonas sp. H1-120]|uniref:Bug family tripartite tricarboxylate transporter substrate binding protein n=1 Tax=Pollutimonas sp. H1-120 TaxID=3148824 RepID=UPI003B516094